MQQRGLASAIAPDDANSVSHLDSERNRIKHGVMAIGLRDSLKIQQVAWCHRNTLSDATWFAIHRLQALAVTKFVQAFLIDTEVVTNLVRHRNSHLFDDFFVAVADRQDRESVDRDGVWHYSAVRRRTPFGQRNALVEPKQGRATGRRLVLDQHGDVGDLRRECVRDQPQRMFHEELKVVSVYIDQRLTNLPIAANMTQTKRITNPTATPASKPITLVCMS